ncbi:MAG TPA: hypothetical protein VH165_12330 [Kofleriaceae bacterium]|nr:hypothetical protein [Kofleriaceae bacterium]
MGKIADQVHTKFKLFTGSLDSAGHIGGLADQIAAWAKTAKVAPKSIGIEFLEKSKQLILSVGYRDDEPAYGIKLASVQVGPLGKLDAADLGKLETAMGEAAALTQQLICHELYVTDDDVLFVVTMAHD